MKPTKPSGIPWLGEVPAHWEVKRLRYGVNLSNERVEVDADSPLAYIGLENIESWTGRLLPLDEDFAPTGISNRVYPGQVMFGKLRPYLAKAAVSQVNGLCSTELMVFQPAQFHERFLLYSLLSDGFIKLIDSSTQGAKMPRADWEFVGNVQVTVPPLPEQRVIAAFLDERTARIDGLLARKQRLVQLLKEKRQALVTRAVTRGLDAKVKLKESGVPWLGEVPEHWGVYPIKRGLEYLTDFEANGSFESVKNNVSFAETDGFAWYVRATDLQNGFIADPVECRWVDEPTYRFLERTTLVAGDLLVAKRGEIGKLYVMPAVDVPSTLAPNMYLLRLNERLHPVYAYYFLMSSSGQAELRLKDRSTTLGALYKDDCKEIMMFFPPLPEQLSIIEEIERSTLRIDALIGKVEQAVLRLQEYRTALISAAVTGKVRV